MSASRLAFLVTVLAFVIFAAALAVRFVPLLIKIKEVLP
jgi:hypothetical protein